jgi:hypothetical protein
MNLLEELLEVLISDHRIIAASHRKSAVKVIANQHAHGTPTLVLLHMLCAGQTQTSLFSCLYLTLLQDSC